MRLRTRSRHCLPGVALLAFALVLGACNRAPDADRDAMRDAAAASPPDAGATGSPPPDAADAGSAPAGGPQATTIGGDGSAIRLDPLQAQDIADAQLPGELACGFVQAEAVLLHAAGMVASDDPALGIVKPAGVVEQVRAPGGFDGLLADPVFTGRGTTIRIVLTGPAAGGGESPPRPATLTVLRADGASRRFEGQWQCGP